jgi:glycosyltransferase involved in cell wall biosynthesis
MFGEVSDREGNEYARRLRSEAAAIPGLVFRMYGRYERQDLSILLQDVDCVVVPSLVPEAGPIVPREALAHGIPVIAARLGALTELIDEGENGLTFDPRRPAELAGILIRLANNENLRLRLRAGARSSVVVTVAEHTRRIRAVYEQAIGDFKMRPAGSTETGEFNALHKALLDLGCDTSRQRLDPGVTTSWN